MKFVDAVADTDAGKELFIWLKDVCGAHKPSIVLSKVDDEINVRSTINNEALRGLYLLLRPHISKKNLISIEIEGIPEAAKAEPKPKTKKKPMEDITCQYTEQDQELPHRHKVRRRE